MREREMSNRCIDLSSVLISSSSVLPQNMGIDVEKK
jgi:hypothetical protein